MATVNGSIPPNRRSGSPLRIGFGTRPTCERRDCLGRLYILRETVFSTPLVARRPLGPRAHRAGPTRGARKLVCSSTPP